MATMNAAERSALAAEILNNPLWEEMKDTLPKQYYLHFANAVGDTVTRERISLAHDIFADVIGYIESSYAMGADVEFPDEILETDK